VLAGITPRIARRGVESSARLSRYRWVVERTISWQQGGRRLRVRHEKRGDIHEARVHLANASNCWGKLDGRFC
jgi:transposase